MSTPSSFIVGTSGSAWARCAEVTASGRSLPERMNEIDPGTFWMCMSTWPPASALVAGPPPVNGTWRIRMPAACMNISAGTCVEPYTPDRSEEHTSELQSRLHLVCRLLLEKKKKKQKPT